ncbi:MAG: hypothetical protein WBB18_17210 [Nodosilinea sp.]
MQQTPQKQPVYDPARSADGGVAGGKVFPQESAAIPGELRATEVCKDLQPND